MTEHNYKKATKNRNTENNQDQTQSNNTINEPEIKKQEIIKNFLNRQI